MTLTAKMVSPLPARDIRDLGKTSADPVPDRQPEQHLHSHRGVTFARFRSGRWLFLSALPHRCGLKDWPAMFSPPERAILRPGSHATDEERVQLIRNALDRHGQLLGLSEAEGP